MCLKMMVIKLFLPTGKLGIILLGIIVILIVKIIVVLPGRSIQHSGSNRYE